MPKNVVPDALIAEVEVCYNRGEEIVPVTEIAEEYIKMIREKLKRAVLELTLAEQEELLAAIKGGKLCSSHKEGKRERNL